MAITLYAHGGTLGAIPPGGTMTVSGMGTANAGDVVCYMVQWGVSQTGGYNAIPGTVGYPSGFTEIDREETGFDIGSGVGGYTTIAWGTAAGGETSWSIAPLPVAGYNAVTMIVDIFRGFAGSANVRDYAHLKSTGSSGAVPSITPLAGAETALWAPFALAPNYHPNTTTGGTLGTEATGGSRQTINSVNRIVTSPSGSYDATITAAGPETGWIAYHVAFDGAAPAPDPEPGVVLDPVSVDPIDISDYLVSWRITRGASAESTGGAQPGQATVVVKNHVDDRFNPENGSSPLASQLVDGTPIWIGVNSDGRLAGSAIRGLFGGRISDITPLVQPGFVYAPLVEIGCEDALGWFGRVPARLDDEIGRSHADLRLEILNAAGETRRSLPPEITTMPLSAVDASTLSALEELNRATGTRHFIEPGTVSSAWYTYVARDRHWNLSGTANGTLDAGSDHVTKSSGWRLSADTVINQQKVTVTPVAFTPAQVTVWEAGTDTIPFTFTASDPRTFWVDFDDHVDSPAPDVNYTGSTVTASLTAFGDSAKLVLASAGTSTVTSVTIEGALARRAPAESYVANGTASQAGTRGVRSGSDISGDFVGVIASAQGLAEHVVWRYGSPQYRPTLTVENWFPGQFDLDLFDTIALTIDQLGITGRIFEIVGLTHEGIRASQDVIHHRTTYVLQESRVQSATNWFITDVHAPDGSAILGY